TVPVVLDLFFVGFYRLSYPSDGESLI
ncbi:hypothetical protein GA0116948_1309, partial [Chitinophaga costaii]